MTTPDWRAEVHDLHDFFEDWLSGRDADIARLEVALADGMRFVGPDGAMIARDALIDRLAGARGARPGLTIAVDGEELILETPALIVATYLEHQRVDGASTSRRSTVVFHRDADAPHGVTWAHVHETWIERD